MIDMPNISPLMPASGNPSMMPAESTKMNKLSKLFKNEMTEMSTGQLDTSFMVSTHKDEATRLISRFSGTVDTLNQILQKV